MKWPLLFLTLLLAGAGAALAQHGTAESGYYPEGYHGDVWTGVVVSANEQTREITLSYSKGEKTETFVGIPEKDYVVHEHGGSVRPLRMSDIPVGRTIKVWYIPTTKKVDGKKLTENTIIQIDIAANAHKRTTTFMAFTR